MVLSETPTARAFQAIRSVSVSELSQLRDDEIRPLLPCLVRMALCSPVDESAKWTEARKEVQKLLSGLEVVNSIVALLSVDFNLLEQDALKEQQLRRKIGGGSGTSVLVESLQNGLALEFERSTSEPSRRLRLVLSEVLRIMSQVIVLYESDIIWSTERGDEGPYAENRVPVAQLVEHRAFMQEVAGLNPGRINTQDLNITEEKVLPL